MLQVLVLFYVKYVQISLNSCFKDTNIHICIYIFKIKIFLIRWSSIIFVNSTMSILMMNKNLKIRYGNINNVMVIKTYLLKNKLVKAI